MKTIQELELKDIMPSSILADEQVLKMSEAIDPQLRLVTGSVREALIMPRIDELDERVIDLLAWQYHVDFYELADNLEVKRKLVKESLKWHMKKGTRWAILKALEMLGIEAEYHNWYEFGGEPFTFTIDATVKPEYYEHSNHEKLIENIYRAVNDSKAARSTMIKLNTNINENDILQLYHGVATGLSGYHHVGLDEPQLTATELYHGIAENTGGRRVIWPVEPELIHELRLYQGIITTEISAFDIKVDYLQPELEIRDNIYLAQVDNLSGQRKIDYQFDVPELEQVHELGIVQTESYAVQIRSEPYNYGQKCRDIWALTGEPEREIEATLKIHTGTILTGHVVINAENEN